jgi:hypothetical protein
MFVVVQDSAAESLHQKNVELGDGVIDQEIELEETVTRKELEQTEETGKSEKNTSCCRL